MVKIYGNETMQVIMVTASHIFGHCGADPFIRMSKGSWFSPIIPFLAKHLQKHPKKYKKNFGKVFSAYFAMTTGQINRYFTVLYGPKAFTRESRGVDDSGVEDEMRFGCMYERCPGRMRFYRTDVDVETWSDEESEAFEDWSTSIKLCKR